LYLLQPSTGRIKRFVNQSQEIKGRFVVLDWLGGIGNGSMQFRCPWNISLRGNCLYVADPRDRCVKVFDVTTQSLVYIWTESMARSGLFSVKPERPWRPLDVATYGSSVFILDRRYARVYRHDAGMDWPCQLIQGFDSAFRRWRRIAIDRKGQIYLLENKREDGYVLVVYDQEGRRVQHLDPATGQLKDWEIKDAAEVRAAFGPPPLALDHKHRFCLPASLVLECPRQMPSPPPPIEEPLARCKPCLGNTENNEPRGLLFDRDGTRVCDFDPSEPSGPPVYQRQSTWFSDALDSRITRCRWHRIELQYAPLPPGTSLKVFTYSDEVKRTSSFVVRQRKERWTLAYTAKADHQRQPSTDELKSSPRDLHDFLVHSEDGRYLWLRIEMHGDGFASPRIYSLRVHYPRKSYVDDLPAVYRQDKEGRRFLDRFLSAFQTEWDGIERNLTDFARYFDPAAVPADDGGQALRFLAGWLGVGWEGEWDVEQNRRLLQVVPETYRTSCGKNRRGTLGSLRRYMQAYLENMTGLVPQQQNRFPIIVEGYRERNYLIAAMNSPQLGGMLPLWSRSVVRRLQLDVHVRVGEVRLVSTGDPLRDVFHEHAHRFRVFVPATWVRTRDDERMLTRAIEQEKPAHIKFELNLVQPGIQIGVQSTLGVDTIIGGDQPTILTCLDDEDTATSRPPYSRLGIDTILGSKPSDQICGPVTDVPILGINSILRDKKELNQ
jgi:phage tail-like protein